MDRPDLELVLAVRQHGSLVMAARALRVAPSVVTKRLAALEAGLGLKLFQRTTRRVSPTAEGDTLCERASVLLRDFAAVEAELRERQAEPAGPVCLAATFGFGRLWVGPALAAFQARHPGVQVQLQLTEQLPDLAVDGFDGAIWLWNAPGHRAAEWVSRRLASNQRVLVAAPGGATPVQVLTNAGEVESRGVEWDVRARLSRALTFTFNGAYTDAKYKKVGKQNNGLRAKRLCFGSKWHSHIEP